MTRSLRMKASIRFYLKKRRYGKGYIKISGVRIPAFFHRTKKNSNTKFRALLETRHPNILACYTVQRGKYKSICAYEDFLYSLEDVCGEASRFWDYYKTNIIGFSSFCQNLFSVLIEVVISLNAKNKSHQSLGVLHNIVFCENDVPKVRNLWTLSTGGYIGLKKDLLGVALILDQIVAKTTNGYSNLPAEVRSFKNLLQNYQPPINATSLKLHPVLFTSQERKFYMYEIVEHLKLAEQKWKDFETHVQRSPASAALETWISRAYSVNIFKTSLNRRINGRYVYFDSCRSLVLFVRNIFAHINHNLG
ncbi:hypothetical protein FRX31_016527, partial [Thalictrum thalictroides]